MNKSNNEIEHILALFSEELMVKYSKNTAVSFEGLEKLIRGVMIQVNETNEKTLGTNCYSPIIVLGLVHKYHIQRFYDDNIQSKILHQPLGIL